MIKGIDVSKWQREPFGWAAEKAQGVEFMFAKASQGYNQDPLYRAHMTAAKMAGLLTGAYHFYQPSLDAKMQVSSFLISVHASLAIADLPLALDFEITEGRPVAYLKEYAYTFLTELEQRTGKTPIIYSYLSFFDSLALDQRFDRFPLWLAEYNGRPQPNRVPAPWKTWTFWQQSGTGLDHDQFNGTIEQLRAL